MYSEYRIFLILDLGVFQNLNSQPNCVLIRFMMDTIWINVYSPCSIFTEGIGKPQNYLENYDCLSG